MAGRKFQPVVEMARELAGRLQIRLLGEAVSKVKRTEQMKNVDWYERQALLDEAIQRGADDVAGKRILVFDDLTDSGATLRRVATLLSAEGGAAGVYALALTRTR